jgi:transcriptional regulator with XRE-family HTH domain
MSGMPAASVLRMPPVPKPKRKRQRHFIREWRLARNKTQEELADYLGVNQSTMSNLENGKTPYDQDVLERLAIYYGCDAGDLLEINPLTPDRLRVVYSDLRRAPADIQARAIGYIEAILKAS